MYNIFKNPKYFITIVRSTINVRVFNIVEAGQQPTRAIGSDWRLVVPC